jgi:hypothetical protein
MIRIERGAEVSPGVGTYTCAAYPAVRIFSSRSPIRSGSLHRFLNRAISSFIRLLFYSLHRRGERDREGLLEPRESQLRATAKRRSTRLQSRGKQNTA